MIRKNILRFLKECKRVVGYPFMRFKLFNFYRNWFSELKDIPGDIVECGVYRGDSLIFLAKLVKQEGGKRKIWGFDSFCGFPTPSLFDNSVKAIKGRFGDTSIDLVRKRLLGHGISKDFIESRINLIAGFFENTLPKYAGNTIALLNLDCDLYESYRSALIALYPKVAKGGIIIFDEYLDANYPGATKAVNDFLGPQRALIRKEKITGNSYSYFFIK